jgi:protein arginine kinase activator
VICDVCAKQKATVHLTEIINDQVTKLNLCEYCAKKKGSQMEQHFGIADLLQGLADPSEKGFSGSAAKIKCVSCGMSYDEFKKIGRLGCAQCYDAFRESLAPLLKRIHSSNTHTGKQPKGAAGSGRGSAGAHSGSGAASSAAAPLLPPLTPLSETAKSSTASKQKPISEPIAGTKLAAEFQQLKQALRKAIDGEAYEEAAQIRDRMRQLEAKIKKAA